MESDMKILSIRRGFLADHSSTSYEFLAVDKPLDARARADVSRLSSRVRPTTRKASFVYHADGYDIPGGWAALMAKHYDVMYSESYDWWTLAVAFSTTNKDLVAKIRKYEFSGIEDLGVDVIYQKKRLVVTINCRMDPSHSYDDQYEDEMWDEEEDEDEQSGAVTNDSLQDLLVRIRDRLKKGDCQALYAVWEKYGQQDDEDDEEEETPPRPRRTKAGAPIADKLAGLLARM